MNVLRQAVAACLLVSVSVSTAGAQVAHVVDQATLDRLVGERIAQDQEDRAAVQRVLAHAHVQRIADRFGVDLVQANAAVATLEGPELQALAAHAADVERGLAGGQSTITLSTTTIIIGLLLLILIIVAVS